MVNIKRVMAHQIDPYKTYKGRDVLQIEANRSTHYSVKTDKQMRVPIADVNEFLRKMKGNV